MKSLIACLLFVVSAIAEPPVDTRYLPPQSNGFGVPSTSYGAPTNGGQTAIFGARQNNGRSRRPSSQYGAPRSSGAPSSLYGAPSQFGASSFASPPSTSYGTPSQFGANAAPSSQYGAPSSQNSAPSNQYSAPSSQYGAPSSQYGAPSSQYSAPSSQYGAPSSQYSAPSSQYGAPDAQVRQPSSQYGAPSLSGPSSFSSAARTPSGQYGAPSQQYGAPSQQYGAPRAGSNTREQSRQYLPPGGSNGGYGGDENGEPASYSFEYMVKDDASGNDFGHREARQGDRTEGLYYVLLPDGRKQTVEYEADQEGYKPKISYEDIGAGGYGRGPYGGQGGQGGPY